MAMLVITRLGLPWPFLAGISIWIPPVQPGHLDLLVLIRKLLGLADHLLDLFFRQAALVVGDGDLLLRLRRSSWRAMCFFRSKGFKGSTMGICLVVSTYPSEKWWSSSVGVMKISQHMESHKSHVPVTTNQQSMGISWNSGFVPVAHWWLGNITQSDHHRPPNSIALNSLGWDCSYWTRLWQLSEELSRLKLQPSQLNQSMGISGS